MFLDELTQESPMSASDGPLLQDDGRSARPRDEGRSRL
jgi:hypothetical protein